MLTNRWMQPAQGAGLCWVFVVVRWHLDQLTSVKGAAPIFNEMYRGITWPGTNQPSMSGLKTAHICSFFRMFCVYSLRKGVVGWPYIMGSNRETQWTTSNTGTWWADANDHVFDAQCTKRNGLIGFTWLFAVLVVVFFSVCWVVWYLLFLFLAQSKKDSILQEDSEDVFPCGSNLISLVQYQYLLSSRPAKWGKKNWAALTPKPQKLRQLPVQKFKGFQLFLPPKSWNFSGWFGRVQKL